MNPFPLTVTPSNEPKRQIARCDQFTQTMFSTLPEDTLLGVFRNASQLPASMNWSSYIDENDLENIIALDRRFCDVATDKVNILALIPDPHDSSSNFEYERTLRVGEVLESENVVAVCDSFFYNILQPDEIRGYSNRNAAFRVTDCHRALRILSSTSCMYSTLVVADPCSSQAFSAETLENLSEVVKVNRLVLNTSNDAQWIKKLGNKLNMLWISNPIPLTLECITRYCSSLKHLVLLEIWDKPPTGFWSCIGASLTTLQIEFCDSCTEDVRGIMTHCRNLKELVIYRTCIIDMENELVTQCLASYGQQAEYLSIPVLELDNVVQILEACPRAKLRIDWMATGLTGLLETAAPRIDSLMVYSFDDTIGDIWGTCTSLRELIVLDTNTAAIMETFSLPMHSLLKISMNLPEFSSLAGVTSCLSQMARSTRNLRMLRIGAPCLSVIGLTNLVRSNQRFEIIELFLTNASTEEETASAVKELHKAPKLLHLRIAQSNYPHLARSHKEEDEELPPYSAVFYKKVQDACNKIRFSSRQVRVRVFGIDYIK